MFLMPRHGFSAKLALAVSAPVSAYAAPVYTTELDWIGNGEGVGERLGLGELVVPVFYEIID